MATVKVINLIDFARKTAKLPDNKVKRLKLMSKKELRIRACVSQKGSWPVTVQAEGHFFVVLQGKITFQVAPVRGGRAVVGKMQEHVLSAGDAIIIPPNMAHGGSVRGRALSAVVEM